MRNWLAVLEVGKKNTLRIETVPKKGFRSFVHFFAATYAFGKK